MTKPLYKDSPSFDSLSDSHIVFSPLSDDSSDEDDTNVIFGKSFNIDDISLSSSDLIGSKKFLEMHGLFGNRRNKMITDLMNDKL